MILLQTQKPIDAGYVMSVKITLTSSKPNKVRLKQIGMISVINY